MIRIRAQVLPAPAPPDADCVDHCRVRRYHPAHERGNIRREDHQVRPAPPRPDEPAPAGVPAAASEPAALLLDDPRFDRHVPPGHHPERPERLTAARAAVAGAHARFTATPARTATDEELARVHDPRFIGRLDELRGQRAYLDPDTYVSPESVDVARLAAGSLVAMVDALLDGPIPKGVALLRPPGHHARPARAMGFCLINNVAVAAAHARARGLSRVAVVDWDVHHGNGTQEMFWRDASVLYASTHQFPFYPGTGDVDEVGEGEGAGYTVNVPMPAGVGDRVYVTAFERVILPVLAEYAPQLVLVSAGFDASARDPLAQMELSPAAFGWMAREIARVAERSAGGRMALVLEGGYDLVALQAGLESAIAGMTGAPVADPGRAPDDESVERAAAWARKKWTTVT
ncbi:MAG TPA: histone deacetylase [Polyangiaceae bacterium]|nr:histone deacetylase [Polyangiaceae bacterium]